MRPTYTTLIIAILGLQFVYAQPHNVINNHQYQHVERHIYKSASRFHTSVKPYLKHQTDTIFRYEDWLTTDYSKKIWNIAFNSSLIKHDIGDFQFTIDPIVNFEIGSQSTNFKNKSWINSRGILIRTSLGNRLAVGTLFVENQAVFNDLRNDRIKNLYQSVIPGQGIGKRYKRNPLGYDYYFSEAYVSYSPSQYFNFQIGTGKNFFGDGYRSLFLSDNSFNYPYFKITTDIWNIKYVNLWAQFQHLRDRMQDIRAHTKKWGSFQYLSWNVTQWLNLSLFEAVIWKDSDSSGYRGFDIQYANPVIYLRPIEWNVGSPDNVLVGAAGKITVLKKTALYGQLILDEFMVRELLANKGSYANKWGFQAGIKTFDMFKIKRLDFQTEFNIVRPFMYSHNNPVNNYAHFNQPLAHPLGSNFAEVVTFLRYGYKRLLFDIQIMYAKHGADYAKLNFGNDIFLSYTTAAHVNGNYFFQGQEVTLNYLNLTLSYIVNPAYNLNIYAGIVIRKQTPAVIKQQELLTFGIRTSIENFYWDF